MKHLRAVLLGTLLASTPIPAWSQVHATLSFGAMTNPSGAWSYGMKSSPSGVFSPLSVFTNALGMARWSDGSTFGGVYYSYSGSINDGGGTISLHPFVGGELAVLRYTAPSTGSYAFSGFFANGDNATSDVYLMLNGVTQTGGVINGPSSSPVAFNYSPLSLTAGDVVDFQVGAGGNGYGFDTIHLHFDGFEAVTPVPEPTSMVLLATGMASVIAVRRRRSRSQA